MAPPHTSAATSCFLHLLSENPLVIALHYGCTELYGRHHRHTLLRENLALEPESPPVCRGTSAIPYWHSQSLLYSSSVTRLFRSAALGFTKKQQCRPTCQGPLQLCQTDNRRRRRRPREESGTVGPADPVRTTTQPHRNPQSAELRVLV